jgi:hypothetical protein
MGRSVESGVPDPRLAAPFVRRGELADLLAHLPFVPPCTRWFQYP